MHTNKAILKYVAAVVLAVAIIPFIGEAGDHQVEVLTFPTFNDGGVPAGVHVCTANAYYKRNMAVQATGATGTGMHVRPVAVNDGGELATVQDVYVASGKLYDTPTTWDDPYLCFRGVDGGVPTSVTVFIHRERGE